MSSDHRITWIGDAAVAVEFERRVDRATHDRVVAVARAITNAGPAGVRDVVPAYHAVTVHFDPLRTDVVALIGRLEEESARTAPPAHDASRITRIPVCYGGAHGPDLAEMAAWSGLSEEEVVARHVSTTYRVYMLGFLPGFAYLGSVDPQIAMPRRDRPRVKVPEGSVGVAGEQTGIYPQASPGGWQLIGRTPVRLMDLSKADPFLLRPGGLVRFHRIDAVDFEGGAEVSEVAA
jgi:KipI family sensor histidine kinase inhibitor